MMSLGHLAAPVVIGHDSAHELIEQRHCMSAPAVNQSTALA